MTERTKKMKETVYTEEVVQKLTDAYQSAESDESRSLVVQDFADQLQTTVHSVRAKLVNLGVYKAKERTTKTGEAIESKADIVRDIAQLMQTSEEVIESLEKANKGVLKMVRDRLSQRV